MKKKMMSLALALVMCMTLCVPAFASESSATPEALDIELVDLGQETVLAIEDELTANGTSVEAEMTDMIATFQAKQRNCSKEEYQKLQALIDSAYDLLDAYTEYQRNGGVGSMAASPSTKVGIAAIVTYFNSQNCLLSSELLMHMESNTKLDSIYIPILDNQIRRQSCWNTYRNGPSSSGSGAFEVDNSTQDLYYAIHLFNWTRDDNTKKITLSDRYDFDYNDRYDSLAETATNFLAIAQDRGEILPFYTTVKNV